MKTCARAAGRGGGLHLSWRKGCILAAGGAWWGVQNRKTGSSTQAKQQEESVGAARPRPGVTREYFYWVDLRGHLYCIDRDATKLPRLNDPAFLRDGRFLNFFWRQLQHNTLTSPGQARHLPTYPYVSPCGRELNYVRAADRPIAFHTLQTTPSGESSLLYAHDLSVPFKPSALRVKDNGRLYHPSPVGLGLLRSALASELSGSIEASDDGFVFTWREQRFPILRLADETNMEDCGSLLQLHHIPTAMPHSAVIVHSLVNK